jgi:hypothetical protein
VTTSVEAPSRTGHPLADPGAGGGMASIELPSRTEQPLADSADHARQLVPRPPVRTVQSLADPATPPAASAASRSRTAAATA